MTSIDETPETLFRDLQGDETASEISEMESLCMQCRRNGTTRLLLTRIPFYKEVVVMSFDCPHCNWTNNELQPAGKIQEEGVKFELNVSNIKDLSRQLVKTEWATLKIPELEFEIPARTQEGVITNIEGIIGRTITGIQQRLETLKSVSDEPDNDTEKLNEFISQMEGLQSGNEHFTFILQDPSGNSFLENFLAPLKDPNLQVTHYTRNGEEDRFLGIFEAEDTLTEERLENEVLIFPTNCPNCNVPCETNMKVTQIPNFKEAIIMATNCPTCGHRTNEVKSGGAVEALGTKIVLKLNNSRDLTRDVLKSETCDISIPELELEVGSYALGGRFTTVEGLLVNFKEQLKSQNILIQGDSAEDSHVKRMDEFLAKIDEIIDGKRKVTFVLDDPCGNSYIENICVPDPDPQLKIEKYERTFEQNEKMGFNDMKTENYT